jgi:CelD/BcsL family acetyltransferase involved in cellulose biosynthesis
MTRQAKTTGCEIRILSQSAEFDALYSQWNELFGISRATVFQSHEWLRTWWTHFETPALRLNIVLFLRDNTLIGIAPLFIEKHKVFGIPVVRRLQFIGRGITDYVDLIIRPGYEDVVLAEFTGYLRSHHAEWDVFDIEDVNESSLCVKLLPDLLNTNGIRTYSYQGNVCPYVDLPATTDLLVTGMDQTTKHEFRRKLKRLQKNYKPYVLLFSRPEDDIERAIRMFALIHGGRWTGLGYPSAFDDEKHQAYHVEFSRKFARRGWLRMFFLMVDDEPVSVSYGFNYRKRIYMYQSNAHASDDVMKCSPGSIIRKIAMVGGIEEGMEIFDYLRGDEIYKYKEWKASETKNYLIRASSTGPRGRAGFVFYLNLELLRKGLDRTRRELFEYKRFTIIKPRSEKDKILYVTGKFGELFRLGSDFILRHSPLRKLIRTHSQHEEGEEEAEKQEIAREE